VVITICFRHFAPFRLFTKCLPPLSQLSYSRRIEQLDLELLQLHHLIADLVVHYKIVLFGLTCHRMGEYFVYSPDGVTCGHCYKLFVPRTAVNTSKHYFCVIEL